MWHCHCEVLLLNCDGDYCAHQVAFPTENQRRERSCPKPLIQQVKRGLNEDCLACP